MFGIPREEMYQGMGWPAAYKELKCQPSDLLEHQDDTQTATRRLTLGVRRWYYQANIIRQRR